MGYNNYVLTPEEALEIYKQAHAGVKQVDIAREFVVSQATVSGIKRGYYWTEVTGHERTRPMTARQDKVIEIYSAYWEEKRPVHEIAARFGVSLTTVYDIRRGRTGSKYTGHPNPMVRKRK